MTGIRLSGHLMAAAFVLAGAATLAADTRSQEVDFKANEDVALDLVSEGITVSEMRFNVAGGINWNPLSGGVGPEATFQVTNNGRTPMDFSIAVAVFDADGTLVGAADAAHAGALDPGESDDIKVTFRYVKRRIFEAGKVQVAVETFR